MGGKNWTVGYMYEMNKRKSKNRKALLEMHIKRRKNRQIYCKNISLS